VRSDTTFLRLQDTVPGTVDSLRPARNLVVADPGAGDEFDGPIYIRVRMTLHVLRTLVGDADFFEILQTWATDHAGGNVTTQEFIDLADSISGQELSDVFNAWLFTPAKPALPAATARAASGAASASEAGRAPAAARSDIARYGAGAKFPKSN
jgi:aminopeptidase N